MSRRKNSPKVSYWITMSESEHKDAIAMMDSIPKTLRGSFVVDLIRFYFKTIREPGEKRPLSFPEKFPESVTTTEIRTTMD